MKVVAVYVAGQSLGNLQVGLDGGVWGFKEPHARYDTIESGDLVVFASGFSGGSPRVSADLWAEKRVARVVVGFVRSGMYVDHEPVWPDELAGEASYPHRFDLELLGSTDGMDLAADGPLGAAIAESLRLSAINRGQGYTADLSDAAVERLCAMIGGIDRPTAGGGDEVAQSETVSPSGLLAGFLQEIDRAGLVFPEHLATRFICGLLAKPFVILAGLSGSGKTQLATALGRWVGRERMHVAAVRPDWTGSEALFGYENLLLAPSSDGRAAWSVPPILDFLLRALRSPEDPHLLILDEMNLAHVERYFADALSGMESGAAVIPNLAREEDGTWRVIAGEADLLPWPNNLLVVGTVNVDETTYQFSPKVLDRSTTLEFRTHTDALVLSPPAPDLIRVAPDGVRRRLVDRFQDLPTAVSDPIEKGIRDLHSMLTVHGREFGHRTYQEMHRYATLAAEAAGLEADEILDHLVLQKILPRIHGSARELSAVMASLEAEVGTRSDGDAEPRMPLSAEKLARMRVELDATHFTAF